MEKKTHLKMSRKKMLVQMDKEGETEDRKRQTNQRERRSKDKEANYQ